MTFRNEEKLNIDRNKINLFKKYLKKNNSIKIFKSRLVRSIYFDNINFEMYQNSIEGLVPRKKIRIRNYPESIDEILLEKKISSAEGRYKTSKKIKDLSFLNKGIVDKDYGRCNPVSEVNFFRSYYLVDNIRITIDENIFYQKYNNHRKHNENLVVAELKYPNNFSKDRVEELFPFTRIRFSKYCNSIEKCY